MAIVIKRDVPFIPQSERKKENPAVFVVRALTLQERAEVDRMLAAIRSNLGTDGTQIDAATTANAALGVCCLGVREIEGLVDQEGQPVEMSVKEALSLLPDPNLLGELMTAILEHNYLMPDRAKNSGRPSKSGRPGNNAGIARAPKGARPRKKKPDASRKGV